MPATSRTDAQRPALRWRTAVAGLLAGVALLGLAEWLSFGARARANADLATRLGTLQAENARTEEMIARYDEFEREADRIEAEYQSALLAVPTEAELAGALDDLERVTGSAGVELVRFVPGPLAAPKPNAPTTAAPTGPAIQSRPITAVVRCSFAGFRDLLGRLAAYPRLLTVESFAMRPATDGRYSVETTVAMNCFYKQAPDAARRR
jgi:Tfp pilus assembly protein PilO